MELKLINTNNSVSVETILVKNEIFDTQFNASLVHQFLQSYNAGARQGSKAQKSRSEVSGGGVKPWRQKGTGKARAGTIRSPLWRKGGVTFAAKLRDYTQKINKKMRYCALRAIFSELIRQDRLMIVDKFNHVCKTRDMIGLLHDLNIHTNIVYIIVDRIDTDFLLASRNIPNINISTANIVNPGYLVKSETTVISLPALRKIEELLS